MSAVGKDSFTLKDIEGTFGVSRGTVTSLTRAGLLEPCYLEPLNPGSHVA